MIRSTIGILLAVSVLAVALSVAARIPYIYTAVTVATVVFIGHLVTLDDDRMGGWNNEYEEEEVWHRSLKELVLKLSVLLVLLTITFAFPGIANLGR